MHSAVIVSPILGPAGSARAGRNNPRLLGLLAFLLLFLPACVLPPDPYPPPIAVKIVRVHTCDLKSCPFDCPSYYVVQRTDTGEQWAIGGEPDGQVGDVYQIRQ